MSDPLLDFALRGQQQAMEAVEHNKTAVHVRGCIECGRVDTEVVYRFGRADQPRCADAEGCAERRAILHGQASRGGDQ